MEQWRLEIGELNNQEEGAAMVTALGKQVVEKNVQSKDQREGTCSGVQGGRQPIRRQGGGSKT